MNQHNFKIKNYPYIYTNPRLGVMTEKIPLYGSHNSTYSQSTYSDTIGKRNYELTNHLGNVLSVISDKPIPVDDANDSDIDWFLAEILNTYDYSAFHAPLTDRTIPKTGYTKDYRYGGSDGQEKTDEVAGKGNHYTAEYWEYDSRTGRRWNIDPMTGKYPGQSPYCTFNNSPLFFKDPTGLEGEPSNENIKMPTKKELKSIEKRINGVKKSSEKLSRQEHRDAKKFQKEHEGSSIREWEDSNGNKRYGVENYESDGINCGGSVKTFNHEKWADIQLEKEGVIASFGNFMGVPDISGDGYGGPIDVIGVSIGYSYTKGVLNMRVYSEYDAILFITRGKDFGLWKSHTSGEKYGLQYEYSANVFAGKYWGSTSSLNASTLEGAGWEAGADILGGVGIWGSFKGDTWQPAWTGVQIGVGPAAGGSVGPTYTELKRY